MAATFSIDRGGDLDISLTLKTDKGVVSTGFTSDDTLTAVVWAGQEFAALATPAVSWVDATAGTALLSFVGDDTADLDPGRYKCRVTVTTTDGRNFSPPDLYIKVVGTAGTDTPARSYFGLEDLIPYYSDLESLQEDNDLARVRKHCELATEWIDGLIQSGNHMDNFLGPEFFSPWSNQYSTDLRGSSKYLQDLLDAGMLSVTPLCTELGAKRALGTYLSSKVGPDNDDTVYQRLGNRFLREATELSKTFKAEIYSPGSSREFWSLLIDLGRVSTR